MLDECAGAMRCDYYRGGSRQTGKRRPWRGAGVKGKGIRWKGLARSFGPDVGPLAAVRGADGAVAGF
jgi:hypothetical protein